MCARLSVCCKGTFCVNFSFWHIVFSMETNLRSSSMRYSSSKALPYMEVMPLRPRTFSTTLSPYELFILCFFRVIITNTEIFIHTHMYTHMHMHTRRHSPATHTHTHTHTYVHTLTRTRTWARTRTFFKFLPFFYQSLKGHVPSQNVCALHRKVLLDALQFFLEYVYSLFAICQIKYFFLQALAELTCKIFTYTKYPFSISFSKKKKESTSVKT